MLALTIRDAERFSDACAIINPEVSRDSVMNRLVSDCLSLLFIRSACYNILSDL
jgi:hypothetical protein